MDCNIIGSQHKCLCRHKFSEYKTDFAEIPIERPILISCRCVSFEYVADASATNDPNCRCKHSLDTHGTRPPYTCHKDCNYSGFRAPFTCTCGEPAYEHITLVETKQEREQCGHPTGYATPYKAMSGLTGFTSLAEGYLRLDASGRSRPDDDDFLNRSITVMDHPILRAYKVLNLSCGISAASNPYDTHVQLTTGIRNNKSLPRRITGGKK
ncbi:unnamed protein product [Adineta steineri]|uniref:Protein FAM221A n=1 Tax=Adineta steineri TaxID=433720 RepID=A0A815IA29_9BILA|nr:unnamed protein product [Adineta steineri]CAF1363346.1 unnamed protein product [Adineta steineri]